MQKRIKPHATVVDVFESAFVPPEPTPPRLTKKGTVDRRGMYKHQPAPMNHPWRKQLYGKTARGEFSPLFKKHEDA